jgi:hypothetical protein
MEAKDVIDDLQVQMSPVDLDWKCEPLRWRGSKMVGLLVGEPQ